MHFASMLIASSDIKEVNNQSHYYCHDGYIARRGSFFSKTGIMINLVLAVCIKNQITGPASKSLPNQNARFFDAFLVIVFGLHYLCRLI